MKGAPLLFKDAPIRDSVYYKTLCRNCIRILQDCEEFNKKMYKKGVYLEVIVCEGFQDYRSEVKQ
jgi:hypothetical protein